MPGSKPHREYLEHDKRYVYVGSKQFFLSKTKIWEAILLVCEANTPK